MNSIRYYVTEIVETLLRVLPFRSRTGLVRVGNPDDKSPVLVTCNFHLTVERVKRALKGLDVYLLVANSRGINVWCAAAGGSFTDHDVISVLKTSGIEDLVSHRTVILPQLAATGIQPKVIRERAGWKAVFGPVYAKDIAAFIGSDFRKDAEMGQVRFGAAQRFEMALAWAFPLSVVALLVVLPFRFKGAVPLLTLIWVLSLLIFLAFPLYSRWLRPEGKRLGLVFFDFGKGGLQLILWGLFLAGLMLYSTLSAGMDVGFILRWAGISLVVILLLSLDLMGSTPVCKSGLHKDRLFKVKLDKDTCRGTGLCEDVCPRNCFHVDREQHTAAQPRSHLCVQCGACIVQCPLDALCFQTPEGNIIPPETIRQYKLNLLGTRVVQNQEEEAKT